MSDRLESALAELAGALRDEVREEFVVRAGGLPELLSIQEAAHRLGIGRTRRYAEMRAGRVRSVKVGRRRLVPMAALAALIAEAPTSPAVTP